MDIVLVDTSVWTNFFKAKRNRRNERLCNKHYLSDQTEKLVNFKPCLLKSLPPPDIKVPG
jgi:hypothetical protein